jgi:ABC-2 type transport system permease protein
VFDCQSGFLREMMVAPVRRSTLLIGKCLGGATVAGCQATVVMASAGFAGVPYRVGMFAALMAELLLTSIAMTVLATLVAVYTWRVQTFHTVLTVLAAPLLFLSGLMFPVSAMPGWMATLTLVDPLTYAVDAMRRTVLAYGGGASDRAFLTPIRWAGHPIPPVASAALVTVFCVLLLAAASRAFCRAE